MFSTLMHSWIFWVWLAGFCAMSPIAFFGWALNSAFLGDSTNARYRFWMFIWFTFLGFVMTWLWPVGIAGFTMYALNEKRKKRRWNKIWKHKKATVPNYWREAYIRGSHRLDGVKVRILDWEITPGITRVSSWDGKLIKQNRFGTYKQAVLRWPTERLELIPEEDK